MTETIAILFIFFVLVFFGILFYYKYSQVSLKQEKEELLGKRAIETTLKALFLPELICSNGEAEPEDNCVDMLKVRHANVTFRLHNQTYFDLLSYSKISIYKVYPESEIKEPFVLYDKPKPDWEKKEATYFVLTLRDELQGQDNYGFGYIKVEVYS